MFHMAKRRLQAYDPLSTERCYTSQMWLIDPLSRFWTHLPVGRNPLKKKCCDFNPLEVGKIWIFPPWLACHGLLPFLLSIKFISYPSFQPDEWNRDLRSLGVSTIYLHVIYILFAMLQSPSKVFLLLRLCGLDSFNLWTMFSDFKSTRNVSRI